MSELRKTKRDNKQKLSLLLHSMGLVVDAQATSTSGRWKIILGGHVRNGLPCYDVLAVRVVDFFIDAHHFGTDNPNNEGETYEEQKVQALKAARRFYEDLVVKMQSKQASEETDEDSGMEITAPDGTKSKYTIN